MCQLYSGGSWPDFFNNTGYINLGINGLALPQKSLLLKENPSSQHARELETQVRGMQPGCRDGGQIFAPVNLFICKSFLFIICTAFLFTICTECAVIFQIIEHII